MARLLTIAAAATAVVLAAGSTAEAQYVEPAAAPVAPQVKDGPVPLVKNNAVGTGRLLLFKSQGIGVSRSLNVDTLRSPGTGLYCVKPRKAIDTDTFVPVVTVDWSTSAGNGGIAEWRYAGADCTAGEIEVMTFVLDPNGTSGLTLSSSIGFTLFIP